MNIGDRIKYKREQKGLTLEELGKLCKTTKQTVYKYENSIVTNIPLDRLALIAQALDVSQAYLMGWNDYPTATISTTNSSPADAIYNALNELGKEEYIRYGRYLTGRDEYRAKDTEPQVEYIRHYLTSAAAGYAAPIEGEDYELVVRGADVPAKADFSIDISGDSMLPYIADGQTVYVQRGADLVEFDVGIFFVDGDVYCKQWCPSYDGSLYLLSANPKRQDANVTISRDAGRSCVCFGKVLLDKKLPRPVYL